MKAHGNTSPWCVANDGRGWLCLLFDEEEGKSVIASPHKDIVEISARDTSLSRLEARVLVSWQGSNMKLELTIGVLIN